MKHTAPESRLRPAIQFAYALIFGLMVILPNFRSSPNAILAAAAALTLIWLAGCIAYMRKIPHADELILCGAVAPLLLGLTQLVFRIKFIQANGGFVRLGSVADTAQSFLLVWIGELLIVLLPGILFFWWNVRTLRPVPPIQPSRPSATKKRT